MPPALIAGAVGLAGSVGGAIVSSNASKNAAKQVAEGNAQAIAEQRRQFDLARQLLAPYVQGGNAGLQGLLNLSGAAPSQTNWMAYAQQNPALMQAYEAQQNAGRTFDFNGQQIMVPGGGQDIVSFAQQWQQQNDPSADLAPFDLGGNVAQQQAISGLEQSPMFQSLVRQGEQGILQNASATGGLRGGNVQGALAQFRPAMLNQQIQQQMANFAGIASMGQNAAAGTGNQAVQTGQQIGNLQQNTGQVMGAGSIASGNAWGGALGSIGNIAGGLFGGGAFGGGGMPNVNQIMAGANASLGAGSPGMVRAF